MSSDHRLLGEILTTQAQMTPNQKASGDTNVATLGGSDKFTLEKQEPENKTA